MDYYGNEWTTVGYIGAETQGSYAGAIEPPLGYNLPDDDPMKALGAILRC